MLNTFISIDLGLKNFGVSIIIIDKDNISTYLKIYNLNNNLIDILNNILEVYNLIIEDNKAKLDIYIERVFKGNDMLRLDGMVKMYFMLKDINIITYTPCSYNLKLKTRKDRKKYSVDSFNNLFSTNLKYLYHDSCDSFIGWYKSYKKKI